MLIGNIDVRRKILVVAEIGNNHEGSFALAEEMLVRAARAGADVVKFQTIVPEELVSSDQTERIRQLRRFCLDMEQFGRLAEIARKEGVLFLSTPFDPNSARALDPLVPAFKIASSDNVFYPLLAAVADLGKPIILSTGLAGRSDIVRTMDFIRERWGQAGIKQELAILHCVSCYPTPSSQANLRAIQALAELGAVVGYSDHTLGIEAAVASAALGARIIEKHFTLDKNYSDFRDHSLSADAGEFALMVERVREIELLLGTGGCEPVECEKPATLSIRRSIALNRDMEAGMAITPDRLRWVRPGGGFAPGEEDKVVGRRLRRFVQAGSILSPDDLEAPESGA